MLDRRLCGRIDIPHGKIGEPCRLQVLTGGQSLLQKFRNGLIADHGVCIGGPADIGIAEGPTEYAPIKPLGGGQIRCHQLQENHLSDVILLGRGLDDGGELRLRGGARRHKCTHNGCDEQDQLWKLAHSI